MSTHHEGNTRYELNRSMAKRCYVLRSRTYMDGHPLPLVHAIDIQDHLVDNEAEAMAYGVEKLRPQIAAKEARARGEDISVPADPVIDRLVAREKADREKREAASRKAAEELQAEREAASRQIDEANPLWGMF